MAFSSILEVGVLIIAFAFGLEIIFQLIIGKSILKPILKLAAKNTGGIGILAAAGIVAVGLAGLLVWSGGLALVDSPDIPFMSLLMDGISITVAGAMANPRAAISVAVLVGGVILFGLITSDD